jgi:hypothetical protein
MASTKATELAQLSRKLTYNEGTNVAAIDGDGSILTTGDNTDQLQEGLTNLYYTDTRARGSLSAGTGVVYDSATGIISIGQAVATTDDVTFNSVTTTSLAFGTDATLSWNSVDGTVDIAYGDATLQIGQEQHYYAKATEAISNGDVVMFAGVQGDHILIAKADVTVTGFVSEWVIGIATEDFALNDFGYVTSFGKVRGINTTGYTAGDLLWLDPATPGGLITSPPTGNVDHVLVAAATNSTVNGTLFVRISVTHTLDEAPGFDLSNKTAGDIIVWNGTNWESSADYYTVAAADSAIATAIANLVDSAPGTLDTLNELAAALGDDPNFATTVTTALADRISRTTDTTDDLNEGTTNLYYTDGRVLTYINTLNIDADTVDGKHYDDIISDATALAIALG